MRSTPLSPASNAAIAILLVYAGATLLLASCAPRRHVEPALPVSPQEQEALADVAKPPEPTGERLIPDTPEPWQKKPPCDAGQDERAINGACWQGTSKRPPCGVLWRYTANGEDLCVRPIAKAKPPPISGQ